MEKFEILSAEIENHAFLHAFIRSSVPSTPTAAYFSALDEEAAQRGHVLAGRPFWRTVPTREGVLELSVCLLPDASLPPCQGQKVLYPLPQVSKSAVARQLGALRRSCTIYLPQNGLPQLGDRVIVDFDAVCENGLSFSESMCRSGSFVMGDSRVPKEFWHAAASVPVGQTFRCALTLPPNFPDRRAAGQLTYYTGTILRAERPSLPEANDAFAQRFGQESYAALEAAIAQQQKTQSETRARKTAAERFRKKYCAEAQINIPLQAIDAEVEWQLGCLRARLKKHQIPMEQHLHRLGKTEEQLLADFCKRATQDVRERFVLLAAARQLDVLSTPEQIAAAMARRQSSILDRMQLRQLLSVENATKKITEQIILVHAESETIPT